MQVWVESNELVLYRLSGGLLDVLGLVKAVTRR